MAIRKAHAVWHGDLPKGKGTMKFGGGAFEGQYSFSSRFEEGPGTNPEELIAAAHAGCFSMAFAGGLAKAGFTPTSVTTDANLHLEKTDAGFTITTSELHCTAVVPGIDEVTFARLADEAKAGCPVSRALSSTKIVLYATLSK